jgi:methylated-DNA-[protein]-cysteine S-methyltransferase
MKEAQVIYSVIESPIGDLLLTSNGMALTGLFMELHKYGPEPDERSRRDDMALRPVAEQLSSYFKGELGRFDMLLALVGTEFQKRVWQALREIPFGETVSYGELAQGIGAPRAVRAVGGAVGRNPISIIVPCHRVIGSNGSLTGFGGGMERKRWLLEHERKACAATRRYHGPAPWERIGVGNRSPRS